MIDSMRERWRNVIGYEWLYHVSDWGRVKSLDRVVLCKRRGTVRLKGRILSLRWSGPNRLHLMVDLRKGGIRKTVCVHRLVAEAWIGHVLTTWKFVMVLMVRRIIPFLTFVTILTRITALIVVGMVRMVADVSDVVTMLSLSTCRLLPKNLDVPVKTFQGFVAVSRKFPVVTVGDLFDKAHRRGMFE